MTTGDCVIGLVCMMIGAAVGVAVTCCCAAASREDRLMEQMEQARHVGTMACKNCKDYFSLDKRKGFCGRDGKQTKAYTYCDMGIRKHPKRRKRGTKRES